MSRKNPKHRDYILAQWPDDLDSNGDSLSSPYPCGVCKKPCYSVRTLRTHKCATERAKANA
jgi:hypothetical protein